MLQRVDNDSQLFTYKLSEYNDNWQSLLKCCVMYKVLK